MNQAYRLKFRAIGADVIIWSTARIVNSEAISIGDRVIIDDFVFITGGQSTDIGSFVHIAAFSSVVGGGRLVLGDFAGLSAGVRVFTGDEDYLGSSLTNPTIPDRFRNVIRSQVIIGSHAIIGANSVILPGIIISEGVAIGANSLVKTDCEPWTVYAGAPAKPIRKRAKEQILELERRLGEELYDEHGTYVGDGKA